MPLQFPELDQQTRELMLSEIHRDIDAQNLYISDNLSPQGKDDYPDMLKEAAENGSDETLANEIKKRLNSHEKPRKLPSGEFSKPPIMRANAHEMLAEGEFNRFYIRALCVKVLGEGGTVVKVYRARQSAKPREESEAMIGKELSAKELLDDLRANPGIDTALGLPPGPNSGLSVRTK